MRTRRIRIRPSKAAQARMTITVSGVRAGVCVAIGIAAATGAAWLVWRAPHCRPVPAHAYYTPLTAAQCAAHARQGEQEAPSAKARDGPPHRAAE